MHILTRILTSRARGPQEGLPGARADRRGGARAEGQRPPEVDKPNRAVFCKASSSDPKAQWGATSTPMCDRKHSPKKRPPGASRSRHAGRGTPPPLRPAAHSDSRASQGVSPSHTKRGPAASPGTGGGSQRSRWRQPSSPPPPEHPAPRAPAAAPSAAPPPPPAGPRASPSSPAVPIGRPRSERRRGCTCAAGARGARRGGARARGGRQSERGARGACTLGARGGGAGRGARRGKLGTGGRPPPPLQPLSSCRSRRVTKS